MNQQQYFCPQESKAIPASVHFARMRAGFSKCKSCEHNQERGMLEYIPLPLGMCSGKSSCIEKKRSSTQHELFHSDETSRLARTIDALANWYWKQQAYTPVKRDFLSRNLITRPQSPSIIIGYDGDYTTASKLSEIADKLNLQGIRLIDAGKLPLSCLEFLRINQEADGYLHLSQIPARQHTLKLTVHSKSGLNPLTDPEQKTTEAEYQESIRELRTAGSYRTHSGLTNYESNLTRRLFGLRPLKLILHVSSPYHHVLVSQLSEEWPCKIVELSTETIESARPLTREMSYAIRQQHADLGCMISADGLNCQLWDEQGEPVSPAELFIFLAGYLLQEFPEEQIFLDGSHEYLTSKLQIFGDRIQTVSESSSAFKNTSARFYFNNLQELWHKDPELRRDGFLTLIYILKKMSQQDTPLSALCRLKTV